MKEPEFSLSTDQWTHFERDFIKDMESNHFQTALTQWSKKRRDHEMPL